MQFIYMFFFKYLLVGFEFESLCVQGKVKKKKTKIFKEITQDYSTIDILYILIKT